MQRILRLAGVATVTVMAAACADTTQEQGGAMSSGGGATSPNGSGASATRSPGSGGSASQTPGDASAATPTSTASADIAPDFALPDTNGKQHRLSDYRGKVVVLEWVNHGCPFVKKHYGAGNMQAMQKDCASKGVVWLSICSSAEGKQGHMTADAWNATIRETGTAAAAVLLDPAGAVGRLYDAKTTPHMFLIGTDGRIAYRGAIDDKPTANAADVKVARNYVAEALEAVLASKPVASPDTKPYGCSVKYAGK